MPHDFFTVLRFDMIIENPARKNGAGTKNCRKASSHSNRGGICPTEKGLAREIFFLCQPFYVFKVFPVSSQKPYRARDFPESISDSFFLLLAEPLSQVGIGAFRKNKIDDVFLGHDFLNQLIIQCVYSKSTKPRNDCHGYGQETVSFSKRTSIFAAPFPSDK